MSGSDEKIVVSFVKMIVVPVPVPVFLTVGVASAVTVGILVHVKFVPLNLITMEVLMKLNHRHYHHDIYHICNHNSCQW